MENGSSYPAKNLGPTNLGRDLSETTKIGSTVEYVVLTKWVVPALNFWIEAREDRD